MDEGVLVGRSVSFRASEDEDSLRIETYIASTPGGPWSIRVMDTRTGKTAEAHGTGRPDADVRRGLINSVLGP